MNSLPKVFVGTMYSNEGDYQLCCDKIASQKGVVVKHFVVAGLKEKEAHNALWAGWRAARHDHDLFVKVDADTVLISDETLATIWDLFTRDPRITGMQAPLHDYMTDGHINGLNAFSPKVTFNDTQDELYCDRRVDTNHDIVLSELSLPPTLVPAGYHCHHASDRQAFHYGLHRMLKNQHHVLDRVKAAWHRSKDRLRAFAIVGAAAAPAFAVNKKFNYDDPEFEQAFVDACRDYESPTKDTAPR